MSFHMNLSSSEEEDFDDWRMGNSNTKQAPSDFTTNDDEARVTPRTPDPDQDSDDDSIDWEEGDTAPAMVTPEGGSCFNVSLDNLKPVSVDLKRKPDEKQRQQETKKKAKKRRKIFRNKSLPNNLASLLQNLHHAHLLSLAASCVFTSNQCSEDEIMGVAHSFLPSHWSLDFSSIPTRANLETFLHWYTTWVNGAASRRRQQLELNRARGAPRRRRRGQSATTADASSDVSLATYCAYLASTETMDPQLHSVAEDVPLKKHTQLKALLLVAMVRSLGWRARIVQVLEPTKIDLDEDHPIMVTCSNIFSLSAKRKSGKSAVAAAATTTEEAKALSSATETETEMVRPPLTWVEVLVDETGSKGKHRWIHIDPQHQLFDAPDQVEPLLHSYQQQSSAKGSLPRTRRRTVAYALAVEHAGGRKLRLTDVTPRYAQSWAASLRARGIAVNKKHSSSELRDTWWSDSIHQLNQTFKTQRSGRTNDNAVHIEVGPKEAEESSSSSSAAAAAAVESTYHDEQNSEFAELKKSAQSEAIPTSKGAFQTHPLYVIPAVLGKCEVLAPDAKKRICGLFKGQVVYRRSDVSTALTAKKWLYEGRRVKVKETNRPIKRVKARRKPVSSGFRALKSYGVGQGNDGSEESRAQVIEAASASVPLEDGMNDLYGKWQTEPWSPPCVGPQDPIPTNEHRNIELALINPGLVHIDEKGLAPVAKKLGVPFAPCLLGFEGHGGNRTPTIRGIVVHKHNEQLIREAGAEVHSHSLEVQNEKRRKQILLRWKRLMVDLLTKERLDREYGDGGGKS